MSWYGWRPYVSVAQRRAQAAMEMEKLRKQGVDIEPVKTQGRKIAHTFWGKAWCDHFEKLSDYANRLPRGRTYVRNGSVCHLAVGEGVVEAMVSGSEIYSVAVSIRQLPAKKWGQLKARCAGQIGSALELLQGTLSDSVMGIVTHRDEGLFPLPKEIGFDCDCPDWAGMCKHIAAVLYGVGARLDTQPALLFRLRGVNHEDLVGIEEAVAATAQRGKGGRRIADDDLGDVFGIDLAEDEPPAPPPTKAKAAPTTPAKKARKKATAKTGAPKGEKAKAAPPKAAKKTPKRAAKAGGARRKKAVVKAAAPKAKRTPRAQNAVPTATGLEVLKLRAKLGMSRAEFSRLLGVTATTVANWERAKGPLNLRSASLAAWAKAARLGKEEAWEQVERAPR